MFIFKYFFISFFSCSRVVYNLARWMSLEIPRYYAYERINQRNTLWFLKYHRVRRLCLQCEFRVQMKNSTDSENALCSRSARSHSLITIGIPSSLGLSRCLTFRPKLFYFTVTSDIECFRCCCASQLGFTQNSMVKDKSFKFSLNIVRRWATRFFTSFVLLCCSIHNHCSITLTITKRFWYTLWEWKYNITYWFYGVRV